MEKALLPVFSVPHSRPSPQLLGTPHPMQEADHCRVPESSAETQVLSGIDLSPS